MAIKDIEHFPSRSSSLATKLLRVVLGVYLLLATLTTNIQLLLEYDNEKEKLTRDINKLAETFEPIFAQAIWNLDNEQIQSSIEGILISENITGVIIKDDQGNPLSSNNEHGNPNANNLSDNRFTTVYRFNRPIVYSNPVKGNQSIGSIELYSSSRIVLQRAAYTFILTIINAIIKTFLLWIVFTYVLNRLVSYPMSRLTCAIKALNPDSMDEEQPEHQALKDLVPNSNDELAELIESFLEMEEALTKKNIQLEDYQKHLEEKVDERTLELKLASQAKGDFLANMSHEIRTPLNGVLGIAEILQHSGLTPNQLHYVTTIQNSGDSLLGIINDILDYSKIEAGKMELELTLIDLRSFINECMTLFSLLASSKSLDFFCYVAPDVPNSIFGDITRLRQILSNLLSNAFKFTNQGQIRLEISRLSTNNNPANIQFSVIDSGIGLNEEDQERIFESFSQADQSTTRKFGGTGLGLSITRNLVHLMGGEIHVYSGKGQGSEFTFNIPMQVNERVEAIFQGNIKQQVNILKGSSCLIIDENENFFSQTKNSLESFQIESFHANSKQQILKEINKNYDFILISSSFSNNKGSELREQLIEEYSIPTNKIILTSQIKSILDTSSSDHSQLNTVLEIPLNLTVLLEILVRIKKNQSQIITSNSGIDFPDYSKLRVLVAEDNQVNQLVILGQLKKFGIVADLANDGVEAVSTYKENFDNYPYDIVFMDCEMIHLDGWEATQQIRSFEVEQQTTTPSIIVAVSAHALNIEREKAVNAGMSDYLPKPITIRALADILEVYFGTVLDDV